MTASPAERLMEGETQSGELGWTPHSPHGEGDPTLQGRAGFNQVLGKWKRNKFAFLMRRFHRGSKSRPNFCGSFKQPSFRGKWQPTPASLPGKSHGQRNLAGSHPKDCRVGYDWATKHACNRNLPFSWRGLLPSFKENSLEGTCLASIYNVVSKCLINKTWVWKSTNTARPDCDAPCCYWGQSLRGRGSQ